MNNSKLAGVCALIFTLALSGCLAKTQLQSGQEPSLSAGNRGFLMEKVPGKTPPRFTKDTLQANEMEMDSIISVFSAVIKKTPNYPGAYYNRAIAYYYKKNYDKAWEDVRMAESLGFKFSPDFIKALQKASPR